MREFPTARIHLSTYERMCGIYSESERKMQFSAYSGVILAYEGGNYVWPGSWFSFHGSLYPRFEKKTAGGKPEYIGAYTTSGGLLYKDKLHNGYDTALDEEYLRTVLYEVVLIPDDEPEDVSICTIALARALYKRPRR